VWGANGCRVSQGRFRVVGCGAFRLGFDGGLGGGFVHFRQEAPWLGELMAGLLGFPGANQQAEALDRGVGIGQGEDRWGFSPISTTWAMVDVEVGNVS
jgi:hypothetical protein